MPPHSGVPEPRGTQRNYDAFYESDERRDGSREAIASRIESDISVVIPADSSLSSAIVELEYS